MKKIIISTAFAFALPLAAQKTANDGDWKQNLVTLKNTPQADFMIRIGDIDNLGFGWEEGYDPFSGKTTGSHGFPWDINPADIKGMDCILLGSSVGKKDPPCGGDGYSGAVDGPQSRRSTSLEMPLASIKGAKIESAMLQLFIDDFQAPTFCSKFQISLNGKRFAEAEHLLNAIEQGGPVGKMISLPLPAEFLPLLQTDKLNIQIDDPSTAAQDGYAIDFVKLLVNPKPNALPRNKGAGYVKDAESYEPIANATVELRGVGTVKTNSEGYFEFDKLLVGLNPVEAFAKGYDNGRGVLDIATDEVNPIDILLQKGQGLQFNGKKIEAGEAIVMNNIQFDQAKFSLRSESTAELDKVAEFLMANPSVEIELAGHTSNEGDRAENRKLSLNRVEACKKYLADKGIDPARLLTVGHGPDKPIAPNDTMLNRAKNRRVEMRIIKM